MTTFRLVADIKQRETVSQVGRRESKTARPGQKGTGAVKNVMQVYSRKGLGRFEGQNQDQQVLGVDRLRHVKGQYLLPPTMPSSESFNSEVACSSCTLAPCICRVGKDKLLAIPCLPTITIPPAAPPATQPRDHTNTLSLARPHSHTTAAPFLSPSPLTDITRLRVRSQPHYCLYAGAEFRGTQKSGRNSYDVTVTIVDVDFASSFLCGYLCIRGLTEDYPELTTYFDAEIIGSRYGFLTQNWGANEADDMVHWSRFPAFRHVRHEMKRPHYTIPDRDRGAVFMRWKERFLVPDHRVQDINGASFAGE